MAGRLSNEINEMREFMDFLERTKRVERIDNYDKTSKCIHVLEDFSSLATDNFKESLEHLDKVNNEYKHFREHALECKRCQESLEAIFLFKGSRNSRLFPAKINKIIDYEFNYKFDNTKGIYIAKLPAPVGGVFGSAKAKLVYITSKNIEDAVEEFEERIKKPLNLMGLTSFEIRRKKAYNGSKTNYWQADCHHKRDDWHTYIRIRSKNKK